MKKLLFLLCLIGISIGHHVYAKGQLENYILVRAKEYGINEQKFFNLAMCESGFTHFLPNGKILKGDHGKSKGILQFWQETFDKYSPLFEEVFDRPAEIINPFDQIDVAMLMLSDNTDNWQHWWNCSKKYRITNYTKKIALN